MIIELLLFLLSLRIKAPTGQIHYLKYVPYKTLQDELSLHELSVIFFSDNAQDLEFADFAIHEFKDRVTFLKSDFIDAREHYQCQYNPCILPFEGTKLIPTKPITTLSPSQFLLWVKNIIMPGMVNVTSPGYFNKLITDHDPLVFHVSDKKELSTRRGFKRPKHIPENFTVHFVPQEVLKEFGLEVSKGTYLFRPSDHELIQIESKGENTFEKLMNSQASNIFDINECDIKLKPYLAGYMIHESDPSSCETEMKILKEIAPKYASQVQFTTLYGKPSELYKKVSDLNTLPTPYFFIFNTSEIEGGRWLLYKGQEMNDLKRVDQFVQKVLADEEDFTVISEEVPSYPDFQVAPFRQVVADNFDEFVISNTNDVLLTLTAPWCHHCAALKPVLNETAHLLKNTNARVYWMDGTKNDIPECIPEIEGYPSIFFFPGQKKQEAPLKYTAGRTFNSILNFITNSSSVKIDVPDYNSEEIQARIKEQRAAQE